MVLRRTNPSSRIVTPSLVAMLFSLLSLLKTSHELQVVDRQLSVVSSPKYAVTHTLTSLVWFGSTVIFRSLSLSLVALYLSRNEHWRGLFLIPVSVVIVGNVAIRHCFGMTDAVLTGAMSAVAPARFICCLEGRDEEAGRMTRNYLAAYVTFNTLTHLGALILAWMDNSTHEKLWRSE